MIALKIALMTTLATCLFALAACGGGGGGDTEGPSTTESAAAPAAPPAKILAEANQNCEQMLKNVTRAGHDAHQAGYATVQELTRNGLAEPGLRLTKELAMEQQDLQEEAESSTFDAYAESFDPIIVLARQWLQAQRKNESAETEHLQALLTELGTEQRVLAQRAGLSKCSVDFLDALVRAATTS